MTLSHKSSPGFLRTSLAAAMTMKLKPGVFYRDGRLHCLNLLLTYPEGCRASCSYCGLSRGSHCDGEQSFIRVEWPSYPVEEIIARAREDRGCFERVCLSMIMHPRAVEDSIELVGRFRREIGLPVSVLVNPSTLHDGEFEALLDAGADMATVAIDAATEKLFNRHRGEGVKGPHKWNDYWKALGEASLTFGRGRIGVHLIAGLGETEQQMVETIQRVRGYGGSTHLFSFYPEPGSLLEKSRPCPADHFRRIQLARFLIDSDMVVVGQMEFDSESRITDFGLRGAEIDDIVEQGIPFMTSGCPGKTMKCACNRPFGDGPPSDIRSYPFQPGLEDIQRLRKQMATYCMKTKTMVTSAARTAMKP